MITYAQALNANGLLIRSSAAVQFAALEEAARLIAHMLRGPSADPILAAMLSQGVNVAIIGRDEQLSDLPGHDALYRDWPEVDWNTRARGLLFGNTVSCPEENLLHLVGDRYQGKSVLRHEFAHALHLRGTRQQPLSDAWLSQAYEAAIIAGRWIDTYAHSNLQEWWAEVTMRYLGPTRVSSPPDGIDNEIRDREQLRHYDDGAYYLCKMVYGKALEDALETRGLASGLSGSLPLPEGWDLAGEPPPRSDDAPCVLPMPG